MRILPFRLISARPLCTDLHGDILHLRNTDAGGTDGFHQKSQTLLPMLRRCVEKTLVFRPRQLTVLLPEGLPLGTEEPDSAILPAQEFQQAVDGGQHGVDGGGGVARLQKMLPPPGRGILRQLPLSQPGSELPAVPEVLPDGPGGALLSLQAG